MDFSVPDSLPSELRQEAKYQNIFPGQVLFNYQDQARYIFALQKGRIRLVRYTREGSLVVLNIIRSRDSFGESALFTDTYQCNALVEKPSEIVRYPKDVVWDVLNDKPHLALNLLPKFAQKSQYLKNSLELRGIRSAKDRTLQYLLFSTTPGQNKIVFDRSYKNIATELGLSAEVLYRTLAELEKSGTISRKGREIKLLTCV